MKLAHITDLHLNDLLADRYKIDARRNFELVLEDVRGRGITDLVLTGDLGVQTSQSWMLDAVASRQMKPMVVLGNHDERKDFETLPFLAACWKESGLYYSYLRDGFLYIYLDSSSGRINQEQSTWLEDELSAPNEDVVIFIHHPIMDCGQTTMDRLYPLQNRETLKRIFSKASCNISVFCGHYHTEHDQRVGNVSQYVTPSVLLQLKQFGQELELESTLPGYRLIELTEGAIRTETVFVR